MNKKLKIAATMVALWGTFLICPAQQSNTVTFNYDCNGNRIGRTLTSKEDRNNEAVMNNSPTINNSDCFNEMKVSLYPNPTHDNVFLSIENSAKTPIYAKLVAETGATLWEGNITGNVESIDLSGQAAGVFLLELTIENEKRIWKVIKK